MTGPFAPIGDRARWRVIYDVLAELEPGDVLTYGRAAELLDLHETHDRAAIQKAIRRAAQENEVVNKRVIEPVKNVGYRVVHASEQAGIAKRYQRKSLDAIDTGTSKVVNVRLGELDQAERNAVAVIAAAFSRQAESIRRLRWPVRSTSGCTSIQACWISIFLGCQLSSASRNAT